MALVLEIERDWGERCSGDGAVDWFMKIEG